MTRGCLSYKRGELEARVWRHPAGSGYVCLLKDWGKGTSQETVQPMVEAQRSARHFIGIRKGNDSACVLERAAEYCEGGWCQHSMGRDANDKPTGATGATTICW